MDALREAESDWRVKVFEIEQRANVTVQNLNAENARLQVNQTGCSGLSQKSASRADPVI